MNWSASAAILLALAVVFGAFGAHALRDRLDAYAMGVWEKAVFYHIIHAAGLLVTSLLPRIGLVAQSWGSWICWLLLAGIVLFSGSLYLLALTGTRAVGAVTPIGGLCFIAAWVLLAVALVRGA
jgi:uncharacterized membrane protein YgdD (TMEM256/DUF423 family)